MRIKKSTVFLTMFILLLAFTGCQNESSSTDENKQTKSTASDKVIYNQKDLQNPQKLEISEDGTVEMEIKSMTEPDNILPENKSIFLSITSGSGKSTLLHMIGGLDTPSSGTVIVDGLNLETLNSEQLALFRRRKVGFIFQQYNLIPDLNVYDNITFPLELDGTQIDKDFIQELLETLNISDKQEMLPAMLSGGEQQRVAIIRALATKPAIILADEPTGNLDTSTSHDVIGLLKMLSRQYQQTLIVITHDNDIAQMADRIVQIEDGKISTKGSDFHVSE